MSSISTIPFDIFKEITAFLQVEDHTRLLKTLNKRITLLYSIPGLLLGLSLFSADTCTDGGITYLLKTVKCMKFVSLGPNSNFSESQLLALSASGLQSIAIGGRLLNLPRYFFNGRGYDDIYFENERSVEETCTHGVSPFPHNKTVRFIPTFGKWFTNPRKTRVPMVNVGNIFVPDIGALFPNLLSLSIIYDMNCMVALGSTQGKTKVLPTNEMKLTGFLLGEFHSKLPPSLQNYLFTSTKPIPDFIMAFQRLHSAGQKLHSLWVRADQNPLPFNLTSICSLPNLTSLSFSSRLIDQRNSFNHFNQVQNLPPNLTNLTLSHIPSSRAHYVMRGGWIPFKNLIHLQSLRICLAGGSAFRPDETQRTDLNEAFPLSITELTIDSDQVGMDTMSRMLSAFPVTLKSLSLGCLESRANCRPLVALVRYLPRLEKLVVGSKHTLAFSSDMWAMLPASLTFLDILSDHSAFEGLPDPSRGGWAAPVDMSQLQALVPSGVPSNSDSQSLPLINGIPRQQLEVPPFIRVGPSLKYARFSMGYLHQTFLFHLRNPGCSFEALNTRVDINTFVFLDYRFSFTRDGIFTLNTFGPCLLKALSPELTFFSTTFELGTLARILNLPHLAHIYALDLTNTRTDAFTLTLGTREPRALTGMERVTDLLMDSSTLTVPEVFLALPPRLKNLSLKGEKFQQKLIGDNLPPTLVRLEMDLSDKTVIYQAVPPTVPTYQLISLNVPHRFVPPTLFSIMSPNAQFISCYLICEDQELSALPAAYPEAILNLTVHVAVTGALFPPEVKEVTWKTFAEHTTKALGDLFASYKSNLTVDQCVLAGAIQLPLGVESVVIDATHTAEPLGDGYLTEFYFLAFPPSLKRFEFKAREIRWSNVSRAILGSPSLEHVSLKGDIVLEKLIQGPTARSSVICLQGKFQYLESFEWVSGVSGQIEVDMLAPKLKILSCPGFKLLETQTFRQSIQAMISLEQLCCDIFSDVELYTTLYGHPSIQSVTLMKSLLVQGKFIPIDAETVNRATIEQASAEKLRSVVKSIQFPTACLEKSIQLPKAPSTGKCVLKTLELVCHEVSKKTSQGEPKEKPKEDPRSIPITQALSLSQIVSHYPVSLTSLTLIGPDSAPPVRLSALMEVMSNLKCLVRAELSGAIKWPHKPLRIGYPLPHSLTSLHLPTLESQDSLPYLDTSPSLTEFYAPKVTLHPDFAIPKTVTNLTTKPKEPEDIDYFSRLMSLRQ